MGQGLLVFDWSNVSYSKESIHLKSTDHKSEFTNCNLKLVLLVIRDYLFSLLQGLSVYAQTV